VSWKNFPPNLKMVGSHGGSGICEVIGRMDYAYELRDEAFFLGPYTPLKITHKPSYYLKKMCFDTVSYHLSATKMVLETVGADHVVYDSDAPPLTSLRPQAIQLVRDLKLDVSDEEAVFWRNAARLLKLTRADLSLLT
jgi:predicted TIM-barrel fold metal-dependent hydrolase